MLQQGVYLNGVKCQDLLLHSEKGLCYSVLEGESLKSVVVLSQFH